MKIRNWKKNQHRKKEKYETNKYVDDIQKFQMIVFFVDSIFNGKIAISDADESETSALDKLLKLNSKQNQKQISRKKAILVNNYSEFWQNPLRMTVTWIIFSTAAASSKQLCRRVGSFGGIFHELCLDFDSIILQISSWSSRRYSVLW